MSTQMIVGLAVVIGAPALPPAAKAPAPPSLVGDWAVETWTMDGKPEPSEARTLTFAADGAFVARENGEHQGAGTYTCDPKKEPAEFDMAEIGIESPHKGIWRVEGDTLTLCVRGDPKLGRPTAFGAPPGSECVLVTLKRVPKKD